MRRAMDEMASHFVSNRFPPTKFLKPNDFVLYGLNENEVRKKEKVEPEMARKDVLINKVEAEHTRKSIVSAQSEVRLVDPQWIRIVDVDNVGDEVLVYKCTGNNHFTHLMAYHEDTSSPPMMAEKSDKVLLKMLTKAFPNWITVQQLIP